MLSETAERAAEPRLRADRSMLVIQDAVALICGGLAVLLAHVR